MDQSQNKSNSLYRKELFVLPRTLSEVECPLLGFHCPISDRSREPEVRLRNQGSVPTCHSERSEESRSDKAGMANYGSVSRNYKPIFLAPLGMTAHLATEHWGLATALLDRHDLTACRPGEEGLDITARDQVFDFAIGENRVGERQLTFRVRAERHKTVEPPARSRAIWQVGFAKQAKHYPASPQI